MNKHPLIPYLSLFIITLGIYMLLASSLIPGNALSCGVLTGIVAILSPKILNQTTLSAKHILGIGLLCIFIPGVIPIAQSLPIFTSFTLNTPWLNLKSNNIIQVGIYLSITSLVYQLLAPSQEDPS